MSKIIALKSSTEITLYTIAQKIRRLFPNGCRKVLLVNVPQVEKKHFDVGTARLGRNACPPPYGLGVLQRRLRKEGYTSEIIDLNYETLSRVHEDDFTYDIWKSVLQKKIDLFSPDAVLVTCMFSSANDSLLQVTNHVRKENPAMPIVGGGVHITNNTKELLSLMTAIDLAITHEADNALVAFLDFVNHKVTPDRLTQISTVENGGYLEIEKLDTPTEVDIDLAPDYGDLPIGEFSYAGRVGGFSWLRREVPYGTLLSTRGCRARCTFCSVESFNGHGTRVRTTKSVVDELQYMVENYGIGHFMWLDDDLFGRKAIEIFDEIARRKLPVTWDTQNGVIASASTEEVIQAASDAGCIGFAFGMESGDPEILKAIKKPSGVHHYRRVGEILKKFPHMNSKGLLMVGFPDETIRQINMTIDMARDANLDWYSTQIVTFLGGTKMTEDLIKRGYLSESDTLNSSIHSNLTEQRKNERRQEDTGSFNVNVLSVSNPDRIPAPEEMADIWFLMDYRVNYPRIFREESRDRLLKWRPMLRDICDRMVGHNPMASLFLGVVNQKLGNEVEAESNLEETRQYIETSTFWYNRFEKLGLNRFLRDGTVPE